MNIEYHKAEQPIRVSLHGRLDSSNAMETEHKVIADLDSLCKSLNEDALKMGFTLDLADVDYVSSAGLAVLLTLHQHFMDGFPMTIAHVVPDVLILLDMTGFSSILNIKK